MKSLVFFLLMEDMLDLMEENRKLKEKNMKLLASNEANKLVF